MTFKAQLLEDEPLIVFFGSGIVMPTEIVEAYSQIAQQPGFRPDLDRFVVFDGGASLSNLDLVELEKIRQAVLSHADEGGSPLEYRTAIVCPKTMEATIVMLYGVLWKIDPLVDVQVKAFSTKEEALLWLGRPDLRLPNPPS